MTLSIQRRLGTVAAIGVVLSVGAVFALWRMGIQLDERLTERAEGEVALELHRLAADLRDDKEKVLTQEAASCRAGRLWSGLYDGSDTASEALTSLPGRSSTQVHALLEQAAEAPASARWRVLGTPVVGSAVPVGQHTAWAVVEVERPPALRYWFVVALVFGGLVLTIVALSAHTMRAVSVDARDLVRDVQALEGDLAHPVRPPRVAVFGSVAEGVRRLARSLREARHRNERLQTRIAAQHRLAALGRVSSGLAHEVRNPLAAIKIKLDVARMLGTNLPEAAVAELEAASSEVDRLDRLVHDLLLLARPAPPTSTESPAGRIARQRLGILGPWARNAGVDVLVDGDADVPLAPDETVRLIDNLVRNAVQASPSGARVDVVLSDEPNPRLSVLDRGPGVPLEVVEQVFEPFFTTRSDGTGLGLALCHALVTASGGELTYSRERGITCFTAEWPEPGGPDA